MKSVKPRHASSLGPKARFIGVGVLNTVFGFSIYSAGIWLGLGYMLASLLALLSGIFFSYFTQGRLVFNERTWSALPRYVAFWLVLWVSNVVLLNAPRAQTQGNDYIAGVAAALILIGPSYLLQKRWVFRNRGGGESLSAKK